MAGLQEKVSKRRTFAIISHPDAGKTTITEQLLLFSGAIRSAGTVKAKGRGKDFATSDWMEIEKQRGISITSSVMQVDYDGLQINILDTPGHEDFSEDTYRTLMAVDAAVMVVDTGKGIEPQTKKLFEVVSRRGIPIFTFMNKLDRDGRPPLELVDELEEILGIDAYPMNWPLGMGSGLLGLYDLYNKRLELRGGDREHDEFVSLDDDGEAIGDYEFKSSSLYQQGIEDAMLLHEAGNEFDLEKIKKGRLTPVFFGSALTGFGVKTFLDAFVDLASAPDSHELVDGEILEPTDERFSGFIFKIQANMNPKHRDRIAFVRICSGQFDKGIEVTLERTGKTMRLAHTTQFMADSREEVQSAVAGDIIGLFDTGNFQIGDSIYTGNQPIEFQPLPQFTPELFMKVSPKNVMKQKSFHKGMEQLVQEGAIQLYKTYHSQEYILGAVGQLQFEIFQHRLLNEYNAEVEMTPMGHRIARWIGEDDLDTSMSSSRNLLATDRYGQPVILFENTFAENWFKDKYPNITLHQLM